MFGEADPLDDLLGLHRELMLIVTSFPGQAEQTIPAPAHLHAALLKGAKLPFIRVVSQDELIAYCQKHGHIGPDGYVITHPDWGTW